MSGEPLELIDRKIEDKKMDEAMNVEKEPKVNKRKRPVRKVIAFCALWAIFLVAILFVFYLVNELSSEIEVGDEIYPAINKSLIAKLDELGVNEVSVSSSYYAIHNGSVYFKKSDKSKFSLMDSITFSTVNNSIAFKMGRGIFSGEWELDVKIKKDGSQKIHYVVSEIKENIMLAISKVEKQYAQESEMKRDIESLNSKPAN